MGEVIRDDFLYSSSGGAPVPLDPETGKILAEESQDHAKPAIAKPLDETIDLDVAPARQVTKYSWSDEGPKIEIFFELENEVKQVPYECSGNENFENWYKEEMVGIKKFDRELVLTEDAITHINARSSEEDQLVKGIRYVVSELNKNKIKNNRDCLADLVKSCNNHSRSRFTLTVRFPVEINKDSVEAVGKENTYTLNFLDAKGERRAFRVQPIKHIIFDKCRFRVSTSNKSRCKVVLHKKDETLEWRQLTRWQADNPRFSDQNKMDAPPPMKPDP